MFEKQMSKKEKAQKIVNDPWMPLLVALIIMVIFDQLNWGRQFGIQFLLLTLMILAGLFFLARIENKNIPWRSCLLLIPILLGAAMTAFQAAVSTTFFNILLTVVALSYLAMTLLNGQWMLFRVREVALGILRLIQSALIDPVMVFIHHGQSQKDRSASGKNAGWQKIQPFIIGVFIAAPLLLIFGALLASADLIFKERLAGMLDLFTIENLPQLIFRAFYIITLGYFMAGAFVHAVSRSAEEKTFTPNQPLLQPFLGHVESLTVLVLVNLLFLSFIIIQFRYFFAGQANISVEGFTYAAYARRGFFELVAVALISLGVYYLLSMFTKRTEQKIKYTFSALGILLMLQVGCMLISAFQRLSLYEAAYGFTTLRTLTHIFMIWLGVVIPTVILMEVFDQFKRLALVLWLVFFGFTLTLNLLNIDRFIARQNLAHALAGEPLDASYLLNNLSVDAIPILFEAQQAPDMPQELQETLSAILACKSVLDDKPEQRLSWSEWHFSKARADRLFETNQENLTDKYLSLKEESYVYEQDGVRIEETYHYYYFFVNGEEVFCRPVE